MAIWVQDGEEWRAKFDAGAREVTIYTTPTGGYVAWSKVRGRASMVYQTEDLEKAKEYCEGRWGARGTN